MKPEQITSFREMIGIYRLICPGTGLSASVMAGIWFHETGGGTSPDWRAANNPGGIKFHHEFFITAAFGIAGNNRDSRYPNHWIAAVAHVFFCRQRRYENAWNKTDAEQITALAKAGYIDNSLPSEPANWINGVTDWTAQAAMMKL